MDGRINAIARAPEVLSLQSHWVSDSPSISSRIMSVPICIKNSVRLKIRATPHIYGITRHLRLASHSVCFSIISRANMISTRSKHKDGFFK